MKWMVDKVASMMPAIRCVVLCLLLAASEAEEPIIRRLNMADVFQDLKYDIELKVTGSSLMYFIRKGTGVPSSIELMPFKSAEDARRVFAVRRDGAPALMVPVAGAGNNVILEGRGDGRLGLAFQRANLVVSILARCESVSIIEMASTISDLITKHSTTGTSVDGEQGILIVDDVDLGSNKVAINCGASVIRGLSPEQQLKITGEFGKVSQELKELKVMYAQMASQAKDLVTNMGDNEIVHRGNTRAMNILQSHNPKLSGLLDKINSIEAHVEELPGVVSLSRVYFFSRTKRERDEAKILLDNERARVFSSNKDWVECTKRLAEIRVSE